MKRQYDEILEMLNDSCVALGDLPIEAINDLGETVYIFISGYVDNTYPEHEGEPILHLVTEQSNGWLRHNHYHPSGEVEESFEHKLIEPDTRGDDL